MSVTDGHHSINFAFNLNSGMKRINNELPTTMTLKGKERNGKNKILLHDIIFKRLTQFL